MVRKSLLPIAVLIVGILLAIAVPIIWFPQMESVPAPTAETVSEPSEPTPEFYACNGERYPYAPENYPPVKMHLGSVGEYNYPWSGVSWTAKLQCNPGDIRGYTVISDLPNPKGVAETFAVDQTVFKITGHKILETAFGKSLIPGSSAEPQLSFKVATNSGNILVFDLNYSLKKADTINGPATYLRYQIHGGYPRFNKFATYRCESVNPPKPMSSWAGSILVHDSEATFTAICGGEGMTIEMSTAR